jgi:hypothetical protein
MLRPDVVLEILLSATLVGAQAMVVNCLGLPFAAVTLFAGLGAYAMAAATVAGPGQAVAVAVLAVACLFAFVGLRRPLPSDRYLLVTLAALAVFETVAGGLKGYGGQLGAPAAWSVLPTYDAHVFLPLAAMCFAAVVVMLYMLERTELGLAVEITRLALADHHMSALVPVGRVTLLILGAAMGVAVSSGILTALYTGRASPDVFGITPAISLLIATLLAGRRAWSVALVSVTFFAFPYLFSSLLGYQLQAMGHVREILTAVAVLLYGERLIRGGSLFSMARPS